MGRPSSYTQETADRICELLASGESLRRVCMLEGMPTRVTVMNWMDDHPDFYAKYARARDIGLDERADRMQETIEQEPDVARARLQLDYGKWYLAKLAPKRYGEKLDLELTGRDGKPIETAVTFNLNPVKGRKPEGGE